MLDTQFNIFLTVVLFLVNVAITVSLVLLMIFIVFGLLFILAWMAGTGADIVSWLFSKLMVKKPDVGKEVADPELLPPE
jgi:Zn-dependent protease with chaperone function